MTYIYKIYINNNYMFVLVDYNKNFEEISNTLNKMEIVPVVLLKINFNNKNQIKQDIEKILEIKNKINQKHFAILINLEKQENNTNNIINDLKEKFDLILGQGGLNKTNKFFIEETNIDFLLNSQDSTQKPKIDFIHHFNSGINHILCKESKLKNIDFIYTLNNLNNKYYSKEIGRINQNLKFARKYNNKIHVNFIIENKNQIKSIIELNSILSLFEISTEQKIQSFNILEEKINKNKLKKTENYISKNINFI